VATVTIFGSFLADWNTTHIYNPNWPPHARFHNGQTMSVGVLLGLAALYFAWRRKGDPRTNLVAAGLFDAFYWISQAMAFLFPGVAWTDPNLLKPGQTLHPVIATQAYLDIALLGLVALGLALSWRATNSAANNLISRS
jgi:hypothetical protein